MVPHEYLIIQCKRTREGVKWTAIRRLVKKHRIDLLCLQEMKREQIDNTMCQAIWGDTDVSWEMQLALNTTGGLLCLWSEKSFKVERKVSGRGFILLERVWTREAVSYTYMRLVILKIKEPSGSLLGS